jgi:hypothetical protein
MLWSICGFLLVLWVLGFSHSIGGYLIHLLFVAAVALLVINFLRGKPAL